MDIRSWVLHTAILTVLIGVSESWVERFKLAKAAQWLPRLILLDVYKRQGQLTGAHPAAPGRCRSPGCRLPGAPGHSPGRSQPWD